MLGFTRLYLPFRFLSPRPPPQILTKLSLPSADAHKEFLQIVQEGRWLAEVGVQQKVDWITGFAFCLSFFRCVVWIVQRLFSNIDLNSLQRTVLWFVIPKVLISWEQTLCETSMGEPWRIMWKSPKADGVLNDFDLWPWTLFQEMPRRFGLAGMSSLMMKGLFLNNVCVCVCGCSQSHHEVLPCMFGTYIYTLFPQIDAVLLFCHSYFDCFVWDRYNSTSCLRLCCWFPVHKSLSNAAEISQNYYILVVGCSWCIDWLYIILLNVCFITTIISEVWGTTCAALWKFRVVYGDDFVYLVQLQICWISGQQAVGANMLTLCSMEETQAEHCQWRSCHFCALWDLSSISFASDTTYQSHKEVCIFGMRCSVGQSRSTFGPFSDFWIWHHVSRMDETVAHPLSDNFDVQLMECGMLQQCQVAMEWKHPIVKSVFFVSKFAVPSGLRIWRSLFDTRCRLLGFIWHPEPTKGKKLGAMGSRLVV